jgi:hypothetical protein
MPTQPSPYSDPATGLQTRKTLPNRRNQHSSPVAAQPLRHHMYDLSILKPDTWEQNRPCWFCGLMFHPAAKSAWQSHFCCTPHRQAFNKYGSLPFEKLMLALREEITKQIRALLREDLVALIEPIVEARVQARKQQVATYIRQTVARFIKDPAKALRELDAIEAGVSAPEK